MAYEVYVRGEKESLVMQDDVKANALIKKWNDYKEKRTGDLPLLLNSIHLTLSQIIRIKKIEENQSDEHAKNWAMEVKRVNEENNKILTYTMEKRARMFQYFRLWYFKEKKMRSEDVQGLEDKVYEIQLKYFTENPYKLTCDPELYKPLLS